MEEFIEDDESIPPEEEERLLLESIRGGRGRKGGGTPLPVDMGIGSATPPSEQMLREILKDAAKRLILQMYFVRGELSQGEVDLAFKGGAKKLRKALEGLNIRPVRDLEMPAQEELEREVESLVPSSYLAPSPSGRNRRKGRPEAGKKHGLVPVQFKVEVKGGSFSREGKAIFDIWRFYQEYESKGDMGRYTGIRFGCEDGPADLVIIRDDFFVVVGVRKERFAGAPKRLNLHTLINRLTKVRMSAAQRKQFNATRLIPTADEKPKIAMASGRGRRTRGIVGQTVLPEVLDRPHGSLRAIAAKALRDAPQPTQPPVHRGDGPTLIEILLDAVRKLVLGAYPPEVRDSYERTVAAADLGDLSHMLTNWHLEQTGLRQFRGGEYRIPAALISILKRSLPERYRGVIDAEFRISDLLRPLREHDLRHTGIRISVDIDQQGIRQTRRYLLYVQENFMVFSPPHGRRIRYLLDANQRENFRDLMGHLTEAMPGQDIECRTTGDTEDIMQGIAATLMIGIRIKRGRALPIDNIRRLQTTGLGRLQELLDRSDIRPGELDQAHPLKFIELLRRVLPPVNRFPTRDVSDPSFDVGRLLNPLEVHGAIWRETGVCFFRHDTYRLCFRGDSLAVVADSDYVEYSAQRYRREALVDLMRMLTTVRG